MNCVDLENLPSVSWSTADMAFFVEIVHVSVGTESYANLFVFWNSQSLEIEGRFS